MALFTKESRLGSFTLALVALCAAPVAYSVHSGLPYNPIKLPYAEQVNARVWAPQGWRFFTRDAQEEQLHALTHTGGAWTTARGTRNADASNLFGASREGRAMHTDIGALSQLVPEGSWRDCKGSVDGCIDATAPIVVKSTALHPLICGEVALLKHKPVPWAWSHSPRPVVMPMRIARLEVQC